MIALTNHIQPKAFITWTRILTRLLTHSGAKMARFLMLTTMLLIYASCVLLSAQINGAHATPGNVRPQGTGLNC